MIELVQEIRSPVRRTDTLLEETAITEQLKSFIVERMKMVELTMMDSIGAALHRHDQLNCDLKAFHRSMELWGEAFNSFGVRIMGIENKLGLETPTNLKHPGKGYWRFTSRGPGSRTRTAKLTEPEQSWQKEAVAAAKKLKAELPPMVSLPDLVRRFGISRNRLNTLIGRQGLKSTREGPHVFVTRESIVQYVREHGIPQPLFRHYGGTAEQT